MKRAALVREHGSAGGWPDAEQAARRMRKRLRASARSNLRHRPVSTDAIRPAPPTSARKPTPRRPPARLSCRHPHASRPFRHPFCKISVASFKSGTNLRIGHGFAFILPLGKEARLHNARSRFFESNSSAQTVNSCQNRKARPHRTMGGEASATERSAPPPFEPHAAADSGRPHRCRPTKIPSAVPGARRRTVVADAVRSARSRIRCCSTATYAATSKPPTRKNSWTRN